MRLFLFFLALFPGLAHAANNEVIVGIRPIAGITAAIMAGVGEPYVLTKANTSPHLYQLSPSDLSRMDDARLIIWVGPEIETFMPSVLKSLDNKVPVLELMTLPGLTLFDAREGGVWEAHDHGHDHGHDHKDISHEEKDAHIWLDTGNAVLIAKAIAEKLAALDPVNATTYLANLEKFRQTVAQLDAELAALLKPVQGKGYIVFHDAYQSFERRYNVTAAGAITVSPEHTPSAKRVKQVREKIRQQGAVCVFAEPQFSPKIIETLLEGTTARRGILDADGGAHPLDAGHYPALMRALGQSLRQCLEGGSVPAKAD